MKKNMKKLYSLLLVLALTVSMAAGCGKTEKSTTNSDTKKEEEVKNTFLLRSDTFSFPQIILHISVKAIEYFPMHIEIIVAIKITTIIPLNNLINFLRSLFFILLSYFVIDDLSMSKL